MLFPLSPDICRFFLKTLFFLKITPFFLSCQLQRQIAFGQPRGQPIAIPDKRAILPDNKFAI